MAKCDYCGTSIFFGGVRDGEYRFCNQNCQQGGYLLQVSDQVPTEMVDDFVGQVHQGPCPKCQGKGPVDVHNAYQVWSMVLLTSWKTMPEISCRSCGVKRQIGGVFFSLFLGWWGFPWGLIMTPMQILRNVGAMFGGPNADTPSPELQRLLRLELAGRLVSAHQEQQAAEQEAAGQQATG